MKALKYIGYVLGGLVVLAIVALPAAVMIVDGSFIKSRLERAMKEKNRTLTIEGEPRVRIFPVAGIELGKTTLTEPGSQKVFVSLERLVGGVRVMPLLSGEAALEPLELVGLTANIVRGKDGRMNFDDLTQAGSEQEGDTKRDDADERRLRVTQMNIERVHINYRDEATGREVTLTDLSLKTGRLDGEVPGPVEFALRMTGKNPVLDLTADAKGALRFNLGRQEYLVDSFALRAKGRIDRDTLAAEFNAPKLEITRDKAGGSAISASLQVKGPARNVNAKLQIAAVQGNARELSIPGLTLDLDALAEGTTVKGRIATPVSADLAKRIYNLPKITANLTFSGPSIPQKTVTLPITASLRADMEKHDAALEVSTRFDESKIEVKAKAQNFEPLHANFDLTIDKLNLDRYLPAESKDKPDAPIDLSALKGKTIEGKVAVGALTAKRVKLEAVKAEIKLANGKLAVAPHSANLYGGSVSGALSADANGNRFQVRENAKNVALGPLLRAALQKDMMEGRGNVTLDVQTTGSTVAALKKALAGNVRVEVKDGAIKGINLAESVRNARGAIGGKTTKADPSQKTDFSEMNASFKIDKGVARNDDLKALSPFVRLGGAGNLDIGSNTIDYLAKAALVASSRGQGGREAGELAGITIPVKLSGPLDNPNWNIDYTALLGGAAGAVGGLGTSGVEAVQKGAGAVGEKLKGIFGR